MGVDSWITLRSYLLEFRLCLRHVCRCEVEDSVYA
jgi:hypothetical protein